VSGLTPGADKPLEHVVFITRPFCLPNLLFPALTLTMIVFVFLLLLVIYSECYVVLNKLILT